MNAYWENVLTRFPWGGKDLCALYEPQGYKKMIVSYLCLGKWGEPAFHFVAVYVRVDLDAPVRWGFVLICIKKKSQFLISFCRHVLIVLVVAEESLRR